MGVFMVSLVLVLSMLVAVLMSDRVQTAAVQWVTHEFAQALGTNAHIGEVHYHFPARVSVHDIYLEDQHQDTLLYVEEVYMHLRPLALLHNEVKFSHAHVKKARAKLYEQDGEWNYQFLVDAFRSKPQEDETGTSNTFVSVRDIRFDSLSVQYADYALLLPHASMDLHELTGSSLDAQIGRLALQVRNTKDSSLPPFIVEGLSARLIRNDSILSMPTLKASLPKSRVDMSGIEIRFPVNDSLSMAEKMPDISFALKFHEAQVMPADLSLLVPKWKGMKRPVSIKGAITGTVDSICCEAISVQYDGRPLLEGDVCATGLPDLEHTYLHANIKDLHTNAARLQDFLSQLQNRPRQLPPMVHRLGDIHYHGLLEGQLHDLTLHGGFKTALGSISTDGTLVSDTAFAHVQYDMRVEGRNFRLGRLLNDPKLSTVTAGFNAKGRIDHGDIYGTLDAHLRQLSYDGYTFNDLQINGECEPRQYIGRFSIDDPHMHFVFDGKVNVRDKNPDINFNLVCHHFDLSPFTEDHEPTVETSFSMAVDLNGARKDEISGYVVIDSVSLATVYDSMLIRQLNLVVSAAPDMSKAITLNSDNLHAQMEGVFAYGDLVPSFQSLLHRYLPTVVPEPRVKWSPVALSVRAEGERLRAFQRLFEAPATISDHSTLAADIALSPSSARHEAQPFVDMRLFAPGVRANGTPIHALTVSLKTVDTLSAQGGDPFGLAFSVSAEVDNTQLDFSTVAYRDTLMSRLAFSRDAVNRDSLLNEIAKLTGQELFKARVTAQRNGDYKGDIRFITHFSKYNKQPLIEWHVLPADLVLRDSTYTLSESQMTYCAAEASLQIDHFLLDGAGQHVRAFGMASAKPTDTLTVSLQQIDASYLIPFVLPRQTIMFNGLMTGDAELVGLFGSPKVETQIHIDSMGLNDCYFGEAEVDLYIRDTLFFHANVDRPERRVVSMDGSANFAVGSWKLDMDVDSVPLDFINHWTDSVMNNLDGYGSGKVIVGGEKKKVYVLLRTKAYGSSFTLPWTNVRYTIPQDSILMDTTSIRFPNVHLTDAYGNPVEINGAIHHDQFKSYDLDLHVDAHDALVFDSNEPGDMIQGSVFATGHVDVTGNSRDVLVQADARTSRNSKFRYSIDNTSSAYESNFIHFVQHPTKDTVTTVRETDLDNIDTPRKVHTIKATHARGGRCVLRLNIEMNPQLLFQLVLGERNGDAIQARGTGALSLRYDTKSSDVSLLGTYEMNQGALSYTVANVIRKEFSVGPGSTIVFSGNPSNPQMDVTAKYRVTASLKDLFGEEINQLAISRTSIPVLTCMHLSGPLNDPLLNFSLEFPSSDQAVQQQVRQVINTDEMLMRQVIYLLVFGRFFTPENMVNMQYATLNSTYSLLSSTVTGQINAWLSKLTNMLTLGVAIRTDGEGSDRSQEYEAQFQLTPVDRLVINGNFGYRYNDISNQPFFGDLDVEVLLTEDGQWRLKGYTHTVDKYSLRQASTIQGVGFLWKKDF